MFSTSNSIIYNPRRSTPISHRAPSPLPAPCLWTRPFPLRQHWLLQPQASLPTPDDDPGACWSGCCPPRPPDDGPTAPRVLLRNVSPTPAQTGSQQFMHSLTPETNRRFKYQSSKNHELLQESGEHLGRGGDTCSVWGTLGDTTAALLVSDPKVVQGTHVFTHDAIMLHALNWKVCFICILIAILPALHSLLI